MDDFLNIKYYYYLLISSYKWSIVDRTYANETKTNPFFTTKMPEINSKKQILELLRWVDRTENIV